MDTVIAKFIVNTPLFMNGADQKKGELRTASLKGMIRFWWRALHYAKHKTLSELKKNEDKLFGNTSQQSAIRFVLEKDSSLLSFDRVDGQTCPGWLANKTGLTYLAFGVVEYVPRLQHNVLSHPCISNSQPFSLRLISQGAIDSSVIDAVKLFGLIGCMGSKSRKGYGSVTLLSLEQKDENKLFYQSPDSPKAYRDELTMLLGHTHEFSIPDDLSFTSFSRRTRIDRLLSGRNPLEILNQYGTALQLYRSWGFKNGAGNHVVTRGIPAEQNFKNDHHWFKKKSSFRQQNKDFHPERAIFGLPHKYFKRVQDGNDLKADVSPVDYERRASPLFFHIHKLSRDQYIGISMIIPAAFLPSENRIQADGKSVDVKENNYQVLVNFIEGIKGHRTAKTEDFYFPEREIIWPQKEEK